MVQVPKTVPGTSSQSIRIVARNVRFCRRNRTFRATMRSAGPSLGQAVRPERLGLADHLVDAPRTIRALRRVRIVHLERAVVGEPRYDEEVAVVREIAGADVADDHRAAFERAAQAARIDPDRLAGQAAASLVKKDESVPSKVAM